ncbi:hypothetical protein QCN27_10385 [Cereibacter sp. SYSU M97828]|nr:hypothetical protein [Cereibacter flavus]
MTGKTLSALICAATFAFVILPGAASALAGATAKHAAPDTLSAGPKGRQG